MADMTRAKAEHRVVAGRPFSVVQVGDVVFWGDQCTTVAAAIDRAQATVNAMEEAAIRALALANYNRA